MTCELFAPGHCQQCAFVVVLSVYEGKLLLSRHRNRATWETQGGHVEPGETCMEAAVRELYEESGVRDARLTPLCDYRAPYGDACACGRVYVAHVRALGALPESEMAQTALFDSLPANLTYPDLTPVFFRKAMEDARL